MTPHGRPTPWLVGPALVALAALAVPLVALVWRAPWSKLTAILAGSEVREAVGVSLVVSLVAAVLCLIAGLPLAWLLTRVEVRGAGVIRALVVLPMVLPPVVGGTALLLALGRRGLVGQWLERWFGLTLPFTTAGAVVAATFVALPFFVVTVESALRQQGPHLEEAAATLGAGPVTTFFTVTLPSVRSAIVAGLALSWARALGEFGATITFAGNLAGRTRTLPLETFLALERDPEAAVAISVVLLAVSAAVLVALRSRWLGSIRP